MPVSDASIPATEPKNQFRIALPEPSTSYDQDAEWCLVDVDGKWREFRFHDYADIYRMPGLYEQLFHRVLRCTSPRTIATLLAGGLREDGTPAADLRVLDLGAGNGLVAEELTRIGVGYLVGADLLPEAAEAARRDRPGTYRDYLVADMANLTAEQTTRLRDHRFTALTCVAALGFGDIPTDCFRVAYDLVADGGWIAITIKDDFLSDRDTSGFSGLIKRAVQDGALKIVESHTYEHRLSTDGTPLRYVAVVGRKLSDL
ncbi:class I SAM-dependent DNA methyltransferase [Fodinicola acaciae]|uniref:class I SAM-dependent DNA methyltransferase n=1 Tax=Fodinicola acaciae TaxID=2681555 RepID=UPI0013D5B493|nr:methyltransferase domain-containing protein [Fodinicola acaciae]